MPPKPPDRQITDNLGQEFAALRFDFAARLEQLLTAEELSDSESEQLEAMRHFAPFVFVPHKPLEAARFTPEQVKELLDRQAAEPRP